ncbi:MAG: hypothetical protein R3E42_09945 [Burkholderiaceae bacterium]
MIKILLPTDGSTRSLDAVRHAIHLIHCGLKARLVVANCSRQPTFTRWWLPTIRA